MTLEQAPETVHVANSLLAELAKYTSIDIDNNVASIAVQHNLAYQRMLEISQQTGQTNAQAQQQVLQEFKSLFRDMTSNQIIVYGVISGLLQSEPQKAEKLLQTSVAIAKQIRNGTFDGKALDSVVIARLSPSGLLENESAEQAFQQLCSDVLTVYIGLEMLPNLLSDGNLHAQSLPSQAYNLSATVKHARRFVALYELISGGTVTKARVCIKIPSTVPGLQAMRYLSSAGKYDESQLGGALPEGSIKVLATTIFAVEQGLAAAQAAGASFTSPYINALAAHFFPVENPSQEAREEPIAAGLRSTPEIIFPLQRCLLRLRADHDHIHTLMKAASFLDPREAVELCGMDQVTIGAPIVDALAKTAVTPEYLELMQSARAQIHPATDDEMEKYGATLAEKESREDGGYGGWLRPGNQSYMRLEKVLTQDARCRYMLADALDRFTDAEQKVRQLFQSRA